MRIALRAPGRVLRRWHLDLAARLRARGHEVAPCAGDEDDSLPPELTALVWFERLALGRQLRALDPAEGEPLGPAPAARSADLVIDLGSDGAARGHAVDADHPVLSPCFDGRFGTQALWAALLAERSPLIGIVRRGDQALLSQGEAALPQPALFSTSLDAVLARVVLLLAQACEAAPLGAPPQPTPQRAVVSPIAFGAAHIARAAGRKLRALAQHPVHWRVGWRRLGEAPDLFATTAWPVQPYAWLDAGAGRYAADPFVLVREGLAHVFCEVFDHRDGRGRIGVFTLDAEGRPGPLRIVLERPYHLSYPFVFERDGQIWMIPETYENRSVELYRAERFPDVWVHECDLFSGVALSDVTLAQHDGRFWLFAADTAEGATTWDALSLFMAEDWKGPWRPHPANPVLVDARAARPAGGIVRRGGVLLRPAQDCRTGYGAGLSLCRIDRLDPEAYTQTTLATLAPLRRKDCGVHTLSLGGGFELIDHCGPAPRW